MTDATKELVTTILAWVGGILAVPLAVLKALEFRRDRANVVVTYRPGYEAINSPEYEANELYVFVNVANRGRRPVTIKTVGAIPLQKGGTYALFADSVRLGPRELQEGKATDYLIKQADFDCTKYKYFVAYDATGREYRCKVRKQDRRSPKEKATIS